MKIHLKAILIILTILYLFSSCATKVETPKATQGKLDLKNWDFAQHGTIDLSGQWKFYWKKFLTTKKINESHIQGGVINVPSIWNQYQHQGKEVGPYGYATYQLTIELNPKYVGQTLALKLKDFATAYKLWINGKLIAYNGKVGKSREEMRPAYKHLVKSFHVTNSKLEILIHCSNFNYAKGGAWENIILGDEDSIQTIKYIALSYDLFLIGSLIIMAIYHFGLFILRTKERSTLLFGIFTLLIGIRTLFRGEMFIDTIFPNIYFPLQIKIEYLSYYFSLPAFYWFIKLVFLREFSTIYGKILLILSGIFSLVVIVTNPTFFTQFVNYYHLMTVITSIWVIISLIRAVRHHQNGSYSAVLGFAIFFLAIANDMLHTNNIIQTIELTPLGLFLFIFSQSFMLSLRFSMAFFNVEKLSANLQKLNQANARFVPSAVLSFLNKESITDIQLGDNIEKEMSILFSDIRNFTSISENMTPEENFLFLNSYLKKIGPVIRQNKGFIDKYLGDGIMALFPEDANTAVQAAVEIQKEIKVYNSYRAKVNYPPVEAGIGIHSGDLMLGTIGEEQRIDATAISDSVNLASRLEGLTKTFGVSVIISSDVKQSLIPDSFHLRKLGNVRVKGKKHAIAIFEVLDGNASDQFDLKRQSLSSFEQGVEAFSNRNFEDAKKQFQWVLEKNPDDKSALYYLKLIQDKREL